MKDEIIGVFLSLVVLAIVFAALHPAISSPYAYFWTNPIYWLGIIALIMLLVMIVRIFRRNRK